MIRYAREDTHYLNYIYQKMKEDLKMKGNGDNLLSAVWENSRQICLKRYRIPRLRPESHLELYRKSKKVFNDRQLYALKELFAWRDRVAREEDESTAFVLPKHMLLQIADILPREMQGILACCSPIPPLVRQNLLHLHEIILKAREMPLISLQNVGQPLTIPKIVSMPREQDSEDPLHCVHDLTHLQDIRDDLPTLLTSFSNDTVFLDNQCSETSDGVRVSFKSIPSARVFLRNAKIVNLRKDSATAFTSPYARYTLVKSETLAAASGIADMERIERTRQFFLKTTENTGATDEQIGGSAIDANVEEKLSKDAEEVSAVKAAGSGSKTSGVKKKLPLSKQIKKKRKEQKKVVENVSREQIAASSLSDTSKTRQTTHHAVADSSKKQLKKAVTTSVTAETISPFDYSEVNYKDFHKGGARDEGQRRGKGSRGRGARGHSNGRVNRKGSQKSLTYSSK